MIRPKAATFLTLSILFFTSAHEIDDSDYPEIYDDYPILYGHNLHNKESKKIPDDFYIVNDSEETNNNREINSPVIEELQEFDNRNVIYSTPNKIPQFFFNPQDLKVAVTSEKSQQDWYNVPEKIYRYTKHRIPGYDYDEFDIFDDNIGRKCDEKSVWTHCLCQFTCTEPNSVNCYSPCEAGCECREEFVFDERTQKCVSPTQCQMTDDYFFDFDT